LPFHRRRRFVENSGLPQRTHYGTSAYQGRRLDLHQRRRASGPPPRHLASLERIARRAGVPVIRLHDLRHTHETPLIKKGVPVKVVSERLGHAIIAFTIETHQHVLPGMQADAADTCRALLAPAVLPTNREPVVQPRVVLLQNLSAEPYASLAYEQARAGDQSGKVETLRRVRPERPTELVAERALRRVRELATRGQMEVQRDVHVSSVPQAAPVITPRHGSLKVPL